MNQDIEKYQKIVQWLLNNVNPEVFEIQSCISRMSGSCELQTKPISSRTPVDLVEVYEEVLTAERAITVLCKHLIPTWTPLLSPPPAETLEVNPSDKFEQTFAKVLPKIDATLSAIEEIVLAINENITRAALEPPPEPSNNQTAMQRQVRFVDKAKRIRSNLSIIEENLSMKEIQPQNNSIEFLYSPPVWSVAPSSHFYLEVLESDVLLNKISLRTKGHHLIGRLPVCDIVIDDVTCSRQHAVIQFRPGDPNIQTGERTDECYIFDLGSTSGTYVNGMALSPKAYYPLYPSDTLQFGQYSSKFVLRDGTESGLFPPGASIILPPSLTTTNNNNNNINNNNSNSNNNNINHDRNDHDQRAKVSNQTTDSKLDVANRSNSGFTSYSNKADSGTKADLVDELGPLSQSSDEDLASLANASKSISSNIISVTTPVKSNSPLSSSQDFTEEQTEKQSQDVPLNKMSHSQVIAAPIIVEAHAPPPRSVSATPVNPKSPQFDESEYKQQMIANYERQQRENEEILRKRKEREEQGLPPIVEIPFVPERPRKNSNPSIGGDKSKNKDKDKDKKKRWWKF